MKGKLTALLIVVIGFCAAATAQVDNCCQVDRQCNNDQDWINGFYAFQNGQCAAPSQPQAASPSSGIAPAQIDNCCFAGWQCDSDQDWINGYHAYQNGQCPAPAQTLPSGSPQPTSSAAGQADNCCLLGWDCINDQEWLNGFHAYQNDDCVGSPRIPSGASCCQMGWNCTIPSDWIMGVWFIREGWQCGMPAQVNYAGVIIEGSELFIARVTEALDLLKSKAPEWYAYVITGPLKIREWLGSHALERSFNLARGHAAEDVVRRARTILHESCHVQRWRVRLLRYETDIQQRTEENLCELLVDNMLDSVQPVRSHNYKLEFEVNRLIGEGINMHELANTERQRAIHLLSTLN